MDVNTVNIDNNSECAASFVSVNGEDCNVNTSVLDAVPHMISRSVDELPQSRPIKFEAGSSFCQIGGCSVPEIALPENTRLKCSRDESSSVSEVIIFTNSNLQNRALLRAKKWLYLCRMSPLMQFQVLTEA